MQTFKHYSAELRHMPKHANYPYLFITDGEEAVYVFGVADLQSWSHRKGRWDMEGTTKSWTSPRDAPGSRTVVTAIVGRGLGLEQRHTSAQSSIVEVSPQDKNGFWEMLYRAAGEPVVEHPKILA